jgi:hypothetical protein
MSKRRVGFVSNSSSSSFIVNNLTSWQKEAIDDRNEAIEGDQWCIEKLSDNSWKLETMMNNFPYHCDCNEFDSCWEAFLWKIEVDFKNVVVIE